MGHRKISVQRWCVWDSSVDKEPGGSHTQKFTPNLLCLGWESHCGCTIDLFVFLPKIRFHLSGLVSYISIENYSIYLLYMKLSNVWPLNMVNSVYNGWGGISPNIFAFFFSDSLYLWILMLLLLNLLSSCLYLATCIAFTGVRVSRISWLSYSSQNFSFKMQIGMYLQSKASHILSKVTYCSRDFI